MKQSLGIRIAIRADADTIRAFLCTMDQTPESGTLLGTLSKNIVMSDGGRHGKVFNEWLAMLNGWLERTLVELEIDGAKVEVIEPGLELTVDEN